MWWIPAIAVIPAVGLIKLIYNVLSEQPVVAVKHNVKSPVGFDERGSLNGSKIVVIGRTGSGKSSLINMLSGRPDLATGPIASTTRWVEGVRVNSGSRNFLIVDTPGYGEAFTADDYATRLVNWVQKHKKSVRMLLLVLQADAKAHADDMRILQRMRVVCGSLPVIIVLNQADKISPVRQTFEKKSWLAEKKTLSLKSCHLSEKIEEVHRQFDFDIDFIEPAVSIDCPFNRRRLLERILRQLDSAHG